MRKIFLGTTVVSLLLALVVGSVLAWTAAGTGSFNTAAGSVSVALYGVSGTGYAIYPTGGSIAVLNGAIQNNTPANPGIAVHVTGGTVAGFAASNSTCNTFVSGGGMSGSIDVTDGSSVQPGGNAGGGWRANAVMSTSAPDECQNNNISYTVTVNVTS